MTGRWIIFWFGAAAIAAVFLFNTSQKVQDVNNKTVALAQAVESEREATRVLKAEWSYLNQPERLSALAKRHLEMQPVTADQMVELQDLNLRESRDDMTSQEQVTEYSQIPDREKAKRTQAVPVRKPKSRPVVYAPHRTETPAKPKLRNTEIAPAREKGFSLLLRELEQE